MASRKVKYGGNAVFYTVLTLGILVLINLVASRAFTRVDLTEDQIYTISEPSKKLVASLPDRLTVKAFISSDLPAQMRGSVQYLRDMLEEYATASKGKMVWDSQDPGTDEKVKEEARRLKVHPVNLSVYEKSKASVTQSYLGLAFQYGGKVEPIPFINPNNLSGLEYDISSTIRRLSRKQSKIGFTSGHGEPSTQQGLRHAKESLKEFEVTTVDLTEGKTPVPDDLDLLIMIGPKKPLAERAKYELDQFLMKGKGLAIFMDGMTLETPRGQMMPGQQPPRIARANVIGLRDMLEHYGVKVGKDIVMDQQNQRVVLPAGQGQRVITNYPAFPIVTDLEKKIPITRDLNSYVSIFPSSVQLTKAVKEGKGPVKATVLARSSKKSWLQTGFFLFDPLRQPQPTKDLGPFDLAVYLQGEFKSYYAGKPVPTPGPAKPPGEKSTAPSGKGKSSPKGTRLVVVADSDLLQDQFLGLAPSNLLLLQNVADYLAEDESLISIRAKGQTRRPLDQTEESSVTWAKWGNIVGLPVIFILLGILRWRWRAATRKARAEAVVKGS
jgi:gliding motility-associatede transport system auxiliary component